MLLSKIAKNPDILSTAIGDETVLLSTTAGKYYGLDTIGTAIWNQLQSPITAEELCAALAREYDGSPEDITRDVLALLENLARDDLIEVLA